MGFGRILIDKAGSATAPSSLKLTLPTQDAYRAANHGIFSSVSLETIRGVMWANGQDQLRHIVTNVLKTGVLAPEKAPTATPTGVRATATLDLDVSADGAYNPANGDYIMFGTNALIAFVTTLPTPLALYYYVVIGATASATLDNLRSLMEETSGRGVTWARQSVAVPISSIVDITAKTATTLAARAKAYGSVGNQVRAFLHTGAWTDCSLGSQGGTVGTIGYFENGADGTGSYPEAGTYEGWAYGYVRTEDGAKSALSPKVNVELGDAMNVTIAAMVSPDDPDDDVDFIRVYRPIASGVTLERSFDTDEDDASEADTISNDVIEDRSAFDESLYLLYAGGYPPRARTLAPFKGSVFAAGARLSADYSAGTASVTNDDNEVTLTGAYPTVEWIGRTFRVSGDSLSYPIVRVTPSSKLIYLGADYEGTTADPVNYTVKDERNPYLTHHSEPLLPNSWQESYNIKGITSPSLDGVLQFVPGFGGLIGVTPTGLWSITGDGPGTYAIHHESEVAGGTSSACALMVEKMFWWLGLEGIFRWVGVGAPENVSKPPAVGGEVAGIQKTIERLNERQLEGIVSVWDPTARILRWFVALDNSVVNNYEIALDLDAMAFSVDPCIPVTAAARVVDSGGVGHILVGDVHGRIFELGVGKSDGAYAFEPVGTVVSATTRTITGTGFPTSGDGLAGVPVYMVSADGAFTRAHIASNTSTVLTLTSFITAPVIGTQIVVGGILWDMETGRFHGGDQRYEKTLDPVIVGFTPQTKGQMWVGTAADQGTPSIEFGGEIDLTDSEGRAVVHVQQSGIYLKMRFLAIAPNFSPNMHSLGMEVEFR